MNLNQLTISVCNVAQSIEFYEKLGLRQIVRSLPEYARFECPEGNATFSLHRTDTPLTGEHSAWIYFEVQDVDHTIHTFIEKGITIAEMPEDKPWLWREARLHDPDGYVVIIFSAGVNRKNPPWRI